ncbi:MAG TPA: BTAD domain-containing putative transcriptional regulator, partial [Micromonosporaceae bacterium]|nr:BTAD domain-containing putative transcriptional regulator [Micromonosporaceae bacterium]
AADVIDVLDIPGVDVGTIYGVSVLLIPVAVGIAVLRHRLYDIDPLISRAVVFGGMVTFITAVYVAVVVGVGVAVGSTTSSNVALAVVATALVGVAFQPARSRLQHVARRLVFGTPTVEEREAGLAIRTLGSFQVFRDGRPVPLMAWQSKKARTLVKILIARRGRATPRDVLMEALWPGEDPAVSTRRLSVALATCRAVLDPAKQHPTDWFVVGDKDAVRLDLAHVPVDLETFLTMAAAGLDAARDNRTDEARRLLRSAEAAYAGDFLEEDLYEDWAAAPRDEAGLVYISVTRVLAELADRSGDHDESIRLYLRLIDKDGWDEAAHLGLIEALTRAGRHGEARHRRQLYATRMAELEL